MKTGQPLLLFALLLAACQLAAPVYSQNVLLIFHPERQKVKTIKPGRKVFYLRKGDLEESKGRLQIVADSFLVIDSDTVYADNLVMIGRKSRAMLALTILGAPLALWGAGQSTFGKVILLAAIADQNLLFLVGGLLDIAFGRLFYAIGTLPAYFIQRRFYVEKGWEIQVLHHSR